MDALVQAQKGLYTTVVIVTHDPRVVARANRTLVVTDGKFANSNAA
ncbi:MAG: hypothetical protein IIC87_00315 [Chloroflexi bacterium]|nr:hypothetical protein [Chloroflexota bacterium]